MAAKPCARFEKPPPDTSFDRWAYSGPAATMSRRPPFTGQPIHTVPELTEIRWQRTQAADNLIGLRNTCWYVIRSTERVSSELGRAVRDIAEQHSAADDVRRIGVIFQAGRSTCR